MVDKRHLVNLAVAGLVSGGLLLTTGCGGDRAASDAEAKTEANGCSAKDGCKAKDSCKAKDGCKAKDSCKSKDGCGANSCAAKK